MLQAAITATVNCYLGYYCYHKFIEKRTIQFTDHSKVFNSFTFIIYMILLGNDDTHKYLNFQSTNLKFRDEKIIIYIILLMVLVEVAYVAVFAAFMFTMATAAPFTRKSKRSPLTPL